MALTAKPETILSRAGSCAGRASFCTHATHLAENLSHSGSAASLLGHLTDGYLSCQPVRVEDPASNPPKHPAVRRTPS